TDTPIAGPSYNPLPLEEEIQFILDTAAQYLSRPPKRSDILSVYVGIRPLVKAEGASGNTAALSRDHTIHVDHTGLLTIVGGKWTTYRRMAEDCVNNAVLLGKLEDLPCATQNLRIHGYLEDARRLGSLRVYGSDAQAILALAESEAELSKRLHPDLPYIAAEVVWAVRHEMARTVDDILSRRTRALFLNARAAMQMAAEVAELMARELKTDRAWVSRQLEEFNAVAQKYLVA
ncbi:MAG TPA: glycerol-3-phosphate dehydrogenase C-terminal domain-containing protein, partial [Acidobacteriaceae bacterium]|nr:glycerol-3-phosphate dehydrogenase C-terminal domain-containing protein [Acidobacteriaceae bacterium]